MEQNRQPARYFHPEAASAYSHRSKLLRHQKVRLMTRVVPRTLPARRTSGSSRDNRTPSRLRRPVRVQHQRRIASVTARCPPDVSISDPLRMPRSHHGAYRYCTINDECARGPVTSGCEHHHCPGHQSSAGPRHHSRSNFDRRHHDNVSGAHALVERP